MPADNGKPTVLIIGGLGFIGRFLALHIHTHKLASDIRLVDKVLPQLAWLGPEFAEACSQDKFMQADASKEQSLKRIFDRADGKEWDYVFDCGGETRLSQEDEIYKLRSLALSVAVGTEAAKRGVKVFVNLSTGLVYKPEAVPRKETDKIKPVMKLAQYRYEAEEQLAKIKGLNLVILRPAHVYGPYDSKYVSTTLCLARIHQSLEEELKWLWTKDLRANTVHVEDMSRAIWAAAEYQSKGRPGWEEKTMGPVTTFNIVDHGNTSQGMLAAIVRDVFKIETGFHGQLVSTFARLNLEKVVDDINEDSLGPWADLLEEAKITRPGPITPFLEKELLKDNDLCLDGALFETLTGFAYDRPKITAAEVDEVIGSYRRMGWWP